MKMMNPLLLNQNQNPNNNTTNTSNKSGAQNCFGQDGSTLNTNANSNNNGVQNGTTSNNNNNNGTTNGTSNQNHNNNNGTQTSSNSSSGGDDDNSDNQQTNSNTVNNNNNNSTNNQSNNNSNNNNNNSNNSLNSTAAISIRNASFSPPSPLSWDTMRRHCNSMSASTNNTPNSNSHLSHHHHHHQITKLSNYHECATHVHYQNNTTNLFTAAGLDVSMADIHDLTNRNQTPTSGTSVGGTTNHTLKPDMSSMYHHHMMQSRHHHHHQTHHHHHHHTDMHDFLGTDPMTAALGLASPTANSSDNNSNGGGNNNNNNGNNNGNHHPGTSLGNGGSIGSINVGGNQSLHTPSSLYSPHHHHHPHPGAMNMNGMISSLHHHHSAAAAVANNQLVGGHPQLQNPFHPHHPNSFVSAAAAAVASSSPHHQLSIGVNNNSNNNNNNNIGNGGVGLGGNGNGGLILGADPTLLEADPRELEIFAERFKQRRIKLGVTQADVGKALANLKLPGVGSLSQSTICRFESLTLSHNNMVALKPILQAWLEAAEAQARKNRITRETTLDICVLPSLDKKRKRTSIAAPEKRSLEAYFSVQPRPSGEKIAAIAEKLDLKKNVVRVWFCNQRQKQKRMKYSAVNGPGQ